MPYHGEDSGGLTNLAWVVLSLLAAIAIWFWKGLDLGWKFLVAGFFINLASFASYGFEFTLDITVLGWIAYIVGVIFMITGVVFLVT